MPLDFPLFVVDDAEPIRVMLESSFKKEYRVVTYTSAEECLAQLEVNGFAPGIFLLDVNLLGMDGYTLCRKLKACPGMANIQVIFISSRDDLESRLEGYGAGGADYVVKPFSLPELKEKVAAARRQLVKQETLDEQVHESEILTSLILSNLDEYALLVKFLRSLNECGSAPALIALLFDLLRGYGLQSAIQIRLPGLEMTVGADGEDRPLEVAIIGHVRNLDRIFEFKTRAAYNFEHITVLINNVPLHDPELCGRLRDHLAIAVESANGKIENLLTKEGFSQAKDTAAELFAELQAVVKEVEKNYAGARYRGAVVIQDMLAELARTFASLGLSDAQEFSIDTIVREKTDDLVEIYDFSGETQNALSEISKRLATILKPAVIPADMPKQEPKNKATGTVSAVAELF